MPCAQPGYRPAIARSKDDIALPNVAPTKSVHIYKIAAVVIPGALCAPVHAGGVADITATHTDYAWLCANMSVSTSLLT